MNNKLEQLDDKLAQLEQAKSQIKTQEEKLQALANNMSLLVSSDADMVARYDINMAAFKEYYPEIHDFFASYQPKKYALEVVEGFINAYNVETDTYLYAYPSFLETKAQFDDFYQSPSIKKFNFNSKSNNEAKFVHADFLDKISTLMPDQEAADRSAVQRKHLSALIIFGVGTGYHLELISQAYTISSVNIVEPDLDLFFISLFSINWQMVLENFDKKGTRVFISLGEQEGSFFDDFTRDVAVGGRYQLSHVAGFVHYQTPQLQKLLTEFSQRYLEIGHGLGFFDDAVMSISHMLTNMKNNVPFLQKKALLENDVADIPVFILGNGPSLDGLIEYVKRYQDKAIIISCGSTLSALYEYGIKPDFHCEQERTSPIAEQISHYCPASFLEGVVLIAPNTVHPEVYDIFERKFMAAKANEPASALLLRDEQGRELFSDYHYINPTVANTALTISYHLGFKEIYLFGIDLGHKLGENHHSKKSIYYSEQQEDHGLYNANVKSKIKVEGNFGGEFVCDYFFHQSNLNLSKQILRCIDLNCYNLNDGAKIEGSIPTQIDELDIMFNDAERLAKSDLVSEIYQNSIYIDKNLSLHQRLVNNLDYDLFTAVCEKLVSINQKPIATLKDASDLMLMNTMAIRSTTHHIHDLLIGTVMHVQVMLTQLLYDSGSEQEGIEKFNQGIKYYCEFLAMAPNYYKEHAENPHYIKDAGWVVRLRNLKENNQSKK